MFGASYITYINLLKGFKSGSKEIESQIEKVVGLELLRLDLEHAGFGIGVDQTDLPLEWDETDKKLTIRSTLNNSNQQTFGWLMVNCSSGSWPEDYVDSRENTSNTNIVFLDVYSKNFVANMDFLTCPGSGIYLGFPVQDSVADGTGNGCFTQWCNIITYSLSSSQNISTCNPNTQNLVRKTGSSALNDGTGTPILNCVADFQVRFDLDTDGDNVVDSTNSDSIPTTATDLRAQVRRVNVYILVQEGEKNSDFEYQNAQDCETGKCVYIDEVELKLPEDYIHYKWKVIKLSVKPMNL